MEQKVVTNRISWILIGSGLVLLSLWSIAMVHRQVASRAAIAAFDAPPQTETVVRTADGSLVNTSLWSSKRVGEFKKALNVRTDPPVAILRIPRIGIEVPVFPGSDNFTLNRGAGWIDGTAEPGANGNCGIAAHRDGFFRGLKDIQVDDTIDVTTHGGVQKFAVSRIMIVEPTRVDVLAPTNEATLTLVTCYPFYFVGDAPKRFIVRATRTR